MDQQNWPFKVKCYVQFKNVDILLSLKCWPDRTWEAFKLFFMLLCKLFFFGLSFQYHYSLKSWIISMQPAQWKEGKLFIFPNKTYLIL
jgi:hypothetical protein